jgi:hypothetical protein
MSDERFIEITGYEAVLQNWPFFLEGLQALNETVKDKPVSPDSFLRVHLDIACGPLFGRIFRLESKNGKPLGFISGYETTSNYRPERVFWVYALYTNRKKSGTPRILFSQIEKWAKSEGFNEIQTQSGRTTTAAIRCARSQLNLSLSKLLFSKSL